MSNSNIIFYILIIILIILIICFIVHTNKNKNKNDDDNNQVPVINVVPRIKITPSSSPISYGYIKNNLFFDNVIEQVKINFEQTGGENSKTIFTVQESGYYVINFSGNYNYVGDPNVTTDHLWEFRAFVKTPIIDSEDLGTIYLAGNPKENDNSYSHQLYTTSVLLNSGDQVYIFTDVTTPGIGTLNISNAYFEMYQVAKV